MSIETARAETSDGLMRKMLRYVPDVLFACVILIWTLLTSPPPVNLFFDQDIAVQMTGGQQISLGEHPFADWRSTYGPLRFYLSYVAFAASGGMPGAEVLLCVLGYCASFVLMYRNVLHLTGSKPAAMLTVAVACLLFPRFHKYLIVLAPMMTLHAALSYQNRPRWGGLFYMAFSVVFGGLYRVDFGLWSLACGVLAVLFAGHGQNKTKRMALAALAGFVLVCALPWVVFLIYQGKLLSYVLDATYHGVGLAKGLALPIPVYSSALGFVSSHNQTAIAFLAGGGLVLLAVIGLAVRWKVLSTNSRSRFVLCMIMALGVSFQALHRSDFHHLLQGLSASLVVCGAVAWFAFSGDYLRRFYLILTCFMLLMCGVLITSGYRADVLRSPDAARLKHWQHDYLLGRKDFIAKVSADYPGVPVVELIRQLNVSVTDEPRVLSLPYMNTVYSLGGYGFASRQMYLAPGYFNDASGQQRMIEQMKLDGFPPVIMQVGGGYDQMDSRSTRAIAPLLIDFIEANYHPDNQSGLPNEYVLWRRR